MTKRSLTFCTDFSIYGWGPIRKRWNCLSTIISSRLFSFETFESEKCSACWTYTTKTRYFFRFSYTYLSESKQKFEQNFGVLCPISASYICKVLHLTTSYHERRWKYRRCKWSQRKSSIHQNLTMSPWKGMSQKIQFVDFRHGTLTSFTFFNPIKVILGSSSETLKEVVMASNMEQV